MVESLATTSMFGWLSNARLVRKSHESVYLIVKMKHNADDQTNQMGGGGGGGGGGGIFWWLLQFLHYLERLWTPIETDTFRKI